MRGTWYEDNGDAPLTPIGQAEREVETLRKNLSEAERRLAILKDPHHGLRCGEARVHDGVVYALMNDYIALIFKVVK